MEESALDGPKRGIQELGISVNPRRNRPYGLAGDPGVRYKRPPARPSQDRFREIDRLVPDRLHGSTKAIPDLRTPPLRSLWGSRLRPSTPEPFSRMTQSYENLVTSINSVREDVEKAKTGNKAACSRVRKVMQEVKAHAQDIRKEMLELRDAGGAS